VRRGGVLVVAMTVVAVGALLGGASGAWGSYSITAMCNVEGGPQPQPQPCAPGLWYTTPVALTWQVSADPAPNQTLGCTGLEPFPEDLLSSSSCEAIWTGIETIERTYTLHVELSDPTATAVLSRPPDFNGWYNHPVGISFQGTSFSGIASCTPTTNYAGPDRMNATVTGTCMDNAGKEAEEARVSFPYDATPPTITGVIPSRPPDYNGWYNHPVSFTFYGADATSGIESCTTPTYAGPDNENAEVVGSCRDRAGNVADFAVPLRYQATPPSLSADADPGDGSVVLHWQASENIQIVRSPGLNGAQTSVLYQGGSGSYNDIGVRNGVHYEYTLTAQDQAGNTTVRSVFATPGPRLLAPAADAHVTGPPLLQWTAVPGASYYNVQLYRRGGKVLSVWPTQPSLQLKPAWHFAGRHYRLKPGLYRWYVWPGLGRRAAARYGRLIGTGTFFVA
jgi:hypothetical protein